MLPRVRIISLCVTLAAAVSLGCRRDARLPLEPGANPIAGNTVDP